MLKRFGFLTMTLAGALALFQPAVAQARDFDDHRFHDRDRFERRDKRDHERNEWREHERFDRRFNNGYYDNRFDDNRFHSNRDRCPR